MSKVSFYFDPLTSSLILQLCYYLFKVERCSQNVQKNIKTPFNSPETKPNLSQINNQHEEKHLICDCFGQKSVYTPSNPSNEPTVLVILGFARK